MTLFSLRAAQEPLSGHPKSISVHREEFPGDGKASVVYLQEMTSLTIAGQPVERRIYRSDGTASYIQQYEHASDGSLSAIVTRDQEGHLIERREVQHHFDKGPAPGTLSSLSADDNEHTSSDPAAECGKPVESSTLCEPGILVRYDGEGRIAEAIITATCGAQPIAFQIETLYGEGGASTSSAYDQEGRLVARHEVSVETGDPEVFVGRHPTTLSSIWERVDSRDAFGNWTMKTVFDKAGVPRISAVIKRVIAYY
jgi:hypothetical protein